MTESVTAATTRHVLGWLASDGQRPGRPSVPVLAISGPQGAGKTTLLRELPRRLFDAAGYRVAALSLDDFYLSRRERLALGREVHPLFVTRGVPGTHDLVLLQDVLDDLRSGRGATIPRFDKALDDRADAAASTRIAAGRLDLIVIEGWCLGLPPERESALSEPINDLERFEDPAGVWRREVNRALATGYSQLFMGFDWVVALLAPSFETVFEWRYEQEQALAASLGANDSRQKLLTEPAALRRFLAHFERLTRHALRCLPNLAQLLLSLDQARRVVNVAHAVSGETPGSRSPLRQ